jgi:hypothetical protein
MNSIMEKMGEIHELLSDAKGIAWDNCHKVYILMDDQEVEQMRGYEYDPLITANEMGTAEMLATVLGWYRDSCGLRFIQATRTTDTGTEFFDVIPQCFDEDEDDNYEEEDDDE